MNHAVDTIVTRWLRTPNGTIIERDGLRVLEFISIQRKDGGEWAIPGLGVCVCVWVFGWVGVGVCVWLSARVCV